MCFEICALFIRCEILRISAPEPICWDAERLRPAFAQNTRELYRIICLLFSSHNCASLYLALSRPHVSHHIVSRNGADIRNHTRSDIHILLAGAASSNTRDCFRKIAWMRAFTNSLSLSRISLAISSPINCADIDAFIYYFHRHNRPRQWIKPYDCVYSRANANARRRKQHKTQAMRPNRSVDVVRPSAFAHTAHNAEHKSGICLIEFTNVNDVERSNDEPMAIAFASTFEHCDCECTIHHAYEIDNFTPSDECSMFRIVHGNNRCTCFACSDACRTFRRRSGGSSNETCTIGAWTWFGAVFRFGCCHSNNGCGRYISDSIVFQAKLGVRMSTSIWRTIRYIWQIHQNWNHWANTLWLGSSENSWFWRSAVKIFNSIKLKVGLWHRKT